MNETTTVYVPENNSNERIDIFLAEALELSMSRSYIQKLIRNGNITVNGQQVKQNYRVKTEDQVIINIPEPEELDLQPENIPLDIIYQDSHIAVIHKPAGMVVHPGNGNWDHTLVNALLYHLKDLSSIGGVARPGIVHRLDKDTEGLMVVAKNDNAHQNLTRAFADREVYKEYTAIISGKPHHQHGIIDSPIGRHPRYGHKMTTLQTGKEAVTEYDLLKIWHTPSGVFSRLKLIIHTGRTHQIRVHCASLGLPIVGDPIYSKKSSKHRVDYLCLGALNLAFTHPSTAEKMEFSIDIPEHMQKFMNRLESRQLA